MLSRTQKEEIVQKIKNALKEAKSLVVVDYTGLPVNLFEDLRGRLIKEKAQFKVVKKTLLNLVFKDLGLDIDLKPLKTQIGIAWGKDEVMPSKILVSFAKENKKRPQVLFGAMDNKKITLEEVQELAALPNHEQMLGRTVMVIKSPITGFVNVLKGNLRSLVYVLKDLATKKA